MSKLIYKADAMLTDTNKEDNKAWSYISAFSVSGGTSRTINVNSTNSMSISSELEQARKFNNLTLFKPPTKNFTDLRLMEFFINKTKFSLTFGVAAFSGRKMVESIHLKCEEATITDPPKKAGTNKEPLLAFAMAIPVAILIHVSLQSGKTVMEEW